MRMLIIVNVLGALLVFLGATMFIPFVVALSLSENDAPAHLTSAALALSIGVSAFFLTRPFIGREEITHRDGFLIVSLGWLLVALFGSLPYFTFAWHFGDWSWMGSAGAPSYMTRFCGGPSSGFAGAEFCSFSNCFFESMSGFTTTGASILERGLWATTNRVGPTDLPHGLLLWRSMTQWIGGMGIVVLAVAILPLLGVGGMQLFKAEVPGPTTERLMPRISQTARQLWRVYVALTVAQIVILMFTGLSFFQALNHALTTMATGGFSPLTTSVAGLNNGFAELVIVFFMFMAGVNFSLHFSSLRSKRFFYWRDTEFRFYLSIVAIATLFIGWELWYVSSMSIWQVVRQSIFQVVSIITTTGFASTDFEQWRAIAPFSAMILFALMFFGGCAGSTGGGPKGIRIWLIAKEGYRGLYRLVHPRAVVHIKSGGRVVDEQVIHGVSGFFALYFLAFAGGALFLAGQGMDLITAASSSITCLSNVGPGFGLVGPASNFNHLPDSGKWLLSGLMMLGRLEVYTVLVLFVPEYWRR